MNTTDSDKILFYEREFYTFSNFSSFAIEWKGDIYMTSEHVYQTEKFTDPALREKIRSTLSAHDAFKTARAHANDVRKDWLDIRVLVMEEVLRAKIAQHPYVHKKLLETKNLEIIEDSPKDDFWGWGPNKDGQNQLGKIWMKIRSEISQTPYTDIC